jgi:rhodanese-related sulfurtransferase
MSVPITPQDLSARIGTPDCPPVIAVTRRPKFIEEGRRIAGSLWRDHMQTDLWGPQLASKEPVVVYCLHGHNVSQIAAARLNACGIAAAHLEGGIDAYEAAGGLVLRQHGPGMALALEQPTVWVTRRRPKIDRIACPWLIRRFIDPQAVFHFVDAEWVVDIAKEIGGIPFDIDGVHYSHRGDQCTFDALLDDFAIAEPALRHLARIVRGADTARLDLEPQCAGLLAMSLGLSATHDYDRVQLEAGMALCDALYGWCRHARGETRNWPNPARANA